MTAKGNPTIDGREYLDLSISELVTYQYLRNKQLCELQVELKRVSFEARLLGKMVEHIRGERPDVIAAAEADVRSALLTLEQEE